MPTEKKPVVKDIWQELRKPFPKEAVGLLPKPFNKDSPKGNCNDCGGYHALPALHLDYVGHAAVTDRLNTAAGPENWNWEPLALTEDGMPRVDKSGNLWIKLTINGVTRIGVGDGKNAKELIGDALRNAAMRFGVALDLWSKEELESNIATPENKNDKPSARQELQAEPSDPFASAGKALMAKGFSRDEALLIIAGMAGVEDTRELKPSMIAPLLETIDREDAPSLAIYLPGTEVEEDHSSDGEPESDLIGKTTPAPVEPAGPPATPSQWTRIKMHLRGRGIPTEDINDELTNRFSVPDPTRLSFEEAKLVLDFLDMKIKVDAADERAANNFNQELTA